MAKLKQYLTESEITDDLKGAYTKKGDRYELNELDSSHSLVVAIKEVTDKADKRQTEIDRLNADKSNLEREVSEAKAKSIPHGFRAVKKEVADIGEAGIAAGLTPDSIANLKTKVDEYEREKSESEKKAAKVEAFRAAGGTDEELFFSLVQANELNLVPETVDGKKKFYNVGADGSKTLFDNNYLKTASGFSSVFDKLTTVKQKQTPFPTKENETTVNLADKIRENEKKRSEEFQTRTVDEAFGRAN